MSRFGSKVTLIHRRDELRGADHAGARDRPQDRVCLE
ncbi:MAG: hypothetical protein R2709_10945 [Marmoricola sp.]